MKNLKSGILKELWFKKKENWLLGKHDNPSINSANLSRMASIRDVLMEKL